MNNVILKPLTVEYKQSVIELFIDCFKDSHFYLELFPQNTISNLRRIAELNIDYIIEDGLSYVALVNDVVVGFEWVIDYKKLATDPVKLSRMFSGSDNPEDNPYFNEIDVPISKYDSVIYIINAGVDAKYRQLGIAKQFIKKTIEDNNNKHVVCDLVNMNLLHTLKQLQFKLTLIDTDYYLGVRFPSK